MLLRLHLLFAVTTLLISASILSSCSSSGGGGGSATAPSDLTRFVFATNEDDDKISTYAFDNNFEQLNLAHQLITADRPKSGIVDPSGQFYYVANATANTLSQYSIGVDGSLTSIAPDIAAGGTGVPQFLSVHPSGDFLYCVTDNKEISKFDIEADGSLSGTVTIPSIPETNSIVIHPSGNSAYVSNFDTNTISQYTIAANGNLSAMAVPTEPTGLGPSAVFIKPGGQFLYVANLSALPTGSISQYSIAGDGSLTFIPTDIPTTNIPETLTIGPTLSFLYSINSNDGTIEQFSIAAGGVLTTPSTLTINPVNPTSIAIDAKNAYAYVGTETTGVHIYTIETDGSLTEVDRSPVAGFSAEAVSLTTGVALKATPEFSYVVNGTTDNTVSQYTVATNGLLSVMVPATVDVDINAMEMTIHPTNRYAYVTANGSVFQYDIAVSGELSAMTTAPSINAGTDVRAIAAEPSGKFVYAANFGANTVSHFNVGIDGSLATQTITTVNTGLAPISIAIHPSGLFAYVANYNNDTISQYTIDTDKNNATYGNLIPGNLIPMASTAAVSSGNFPVSVTAHPSGKYLYALNKNNADLADLTTTGDITMYDIASDGSLSVFTALITPVTGRGAIAIAVDASGESAYVTNAGDNTVSQFSINQNDGKLIAKLTASVANSAKPHAIHTEASGQFAYVSNITASNISQYKLASNGNLNILAIPTVTAGTQPRSIQSIVTYE